MSNINCQNMRIVVRRGDYRAGNVEVQVIDVGGKENELEYDVIFDGFRVFVTRILVLGNIAFSFYGED